MAMTAAGVSQEAICAVLRVSRPTLERHCRYELDTGLATATAAVAKSLFNLAVRGPANVRLGAAMFWLKCRAGWQEPPLREPPWKSIDEMSSAEIDARLGIERARRGFGDDHVVDFPHPPR
jgi:hypothetical protein